MTSKRDAIKGESMGFRIRKSISLGKGMRVNLGKNGISSVTFGKRGAPHVTVGKRGTYVGASIPGTGISYSQKISDEKPAKAKKAKKNTKRSKADAAQLPLTTSPVETTVMPYPSDADKLTLTNTPSVSTNELSNSNGPTDPPTGGKHTKKSKQPGSWKRWIGIIIVAVVALAIGNMSADPTQSSQYKQLEQQLTSQKQHNNKLQRQVDELNRKLDDIQDLKDQLEQQKAEQDSQQKQLDQQQSEQEQKQQEQDQKQQEQHSSTSVKRTSRNVRKPRSRLKNNSWPKWRSSSPKLRNRRRRLRRQRHSVERMVARSALPQELRRNPIAALRYSRVGRHPIADCAGCANYRL